jgi:CheY-like chemotaxis protein
MKLKILLVDDTPDILYNLRDYLLMEDYEVFTALNGIEALLILADELPDLIVTDLLMPEMDGFELVERLKRDKKFEHIPIIAFSAKPMSEFNDRTLDVNRFFLKPCSPEVLAMTISQLLDQ